MKKFDFNELRKTTDQGTDSISSSLKTALGPAGKPIEDMGKKLGDLLSDFIDSLF
ncbi:MAG: hypothetical protein MJ143_06285 [Clostridia bacterium]|nr:hypothetical protein [Clostridia bacterium]